MKLQDLVDDFVATTGEPLTAADLADAGGSVTVTVHLNGTRSARSYYFVEAVQPPQPIEIVEPGPTPQ